jgi:hypothetical protein
VLQAFMKKYILRFWYSNYRFATSFDTLEQAQCEIDMLAEKAKHDGVNFEWTLAMV